MEEAFFAGDDKFYEFENAEDDLIDAYVLNELSPEQQQQFEAKLRTSPRLIERVHFARALAERVARPVATADEDFFRKTSPVSQPVRKTDVRWWPGFFGTQPAYRTAFAASVLMFLVGSASLFGTWLHFRRQSEQINSEREALLQQKEDFDSLSTQQKTKIEELKAELQRERDRVAEEFRLLELQRATNLKEVQPRQGSLTNFATLFLTPGSLRGDGAQAPLVLRAGIATVLLNLALEQNDYPRYNAEIARSDGKVVLRKRGLKARNTKSGSLLSFQAPATTLSQGNHRVQVDGVTSSGLVEGVSDYRFMVRIEK